MSPLVWSQSLCWELLQLQLEVNTPWLVGPSPYSLFSASVPSGLGLQKRRWAPQATSARWETYSCILYTLRQTATSSWRLGHELSLVQEASLGTVGAGSSSNLFWFGESFAEPFLSTNYFEYRLIVSFLAARVSLSTGICLFWKNNACLTYKFELWSISNFQRHSRPNYFTQIPLKGPGSFMWVYNVFVCFPWICFRISAQP